LKRKALHTIAIAVDDEALGVLQQALTVRRALSNGDLNVIERVMEAACDVLDSKPGTRAVEISLDTSDRRRAHVHVYSEAPKKK
jgi:hypothetical protein